jgi:NAD(P)-dependent dehydrogenase (short-subunit alcohol dehydrogenase family)
MKTILITGGSGRIGFQFLKHFLGNESEVIITTTNKERFLDSKQKELSVLNCDFLKIIEVDFNEESSENKITKFLKDNNIKVTDIIHNARSIDFLKIENDKTTSKENFLGEFYLDVAFPYKLSMEILNTIPNNLENIIFISSMYGVVAPTPSLYDDFEKSSPIQYGVAKAAQIHLVKEMAVRLGPEIRVNCISFGGVKGRTDIKFEQRYKKLNPLNKMLNVEDVVGPIDFLISKSSQNMTGHNLKVDGGWTLS